MPDEVKLMLEFRVDDSVDTSGTQDAADNAGTEIGISKPGAKKMRKLHLSYYSLSKPWAKFHRAAQAQEEAKYNKIMPKQNKVTSQKTILHVLSVAGVLPNFAKQKLLGQ